MKWQVFWEQTAKFKVKINTKKNRLLSMDAPVFLYVLLYKNLLCSSYTI